MKKTRLIALLLVLCFCVTPLFSCDGAGGSDGVDGGGLNDDGSVNWDEVDFKGSTVKFAVSSNQNAEVTFGASNVYLEGADSITTDEVLKKVKTRNEKVEKDLNLKVEYSHVNVWYDGVLEDIKMKVQGSATDAPDLYNNDLFGLDRALIAGYLMNVLNPTDAKGELQSSYFDFSYDGWKYDFMQESTFDSSKVFLLVGDYHIDVIRSLWLLYVNKTMFNQNASSLGTADVNQFYSYVKAGIWDYEMLNNLCSKVWQDDGDVKDKADTADSRVGLAINHVSCWLFTSATGVTTFYINEDGKASVIDDTYEYNLVSNGFQAIYTSTRGAGEGVYYQYELLASTTNFMKGNFLFAHSLLGEMESDEMRNVSFEKGLVPVPKYDHKRQENYHTMVHDQAEVSAILVTTSSFARASAFMQYSVEASRDVLTEYYEFSLKFKYNEDHALRSMIDLVYDTVDSPFGMQFSRIIREYSPTPLDDLYYAVETGGQVSTLYDRNRDAYRSMLDKVLEDFAKIK